MIIYKPEQGLTGAELSQLEAFLAGKLSRALRYSDINECVELLERYRKKRVRLNFVLLKEPPQMTIRVVTASEALPANANAFVEFEEGTKLISLDGPSKTLYQDGKHHFLVALTMPSTIRLVNAVESERRATTIPFPAELFWRRILDTIYKRS